jgi:hypothetical protein
MSFPSALASAEDRPVTSPASRPGEGIPLHSAPPDSDNLTGVDPTTNRGEDKMRNPSEAGRAQYWLKVHGSLENPVENDWFRGYQEWHRRYDNVTMFRQRPGVSAFRGGVGFIVPLLVLALPLLSFYSVALLCRGTMASRRSA